MKYLIVYNKNYSTVRCLLNVFSFVLYIDAVLGRCLVSKIYWAMLTQQKYTEWRWLSKMFYSKLIMNTFYIGSEPLTVSPSLFTLFFIIFSCYLSNLYQGFYLFSDHMNFPFSCPKSPTFPGTLSFVLFLCYFQKLFL